MQNSTSEHFEELRQMVRPLLTATGMLADNMSEAVLRHYYRELSRFFLRFLDEYTLHRGIHFGGPFPKTDYLLKEYHAPDRLRVMVNDARVRFRHLRQTDADELGGHVLADFEAVCSLVALVAGGSVPGDMAAVFPAHQPPRRKFPKTDCIRLIVSRWDETCIYGQADLYPDEELCVCYGEANDRYPYDWSYLAACLHEGTQLNLVCPERRDDGRFYPELVIVEPDYLVDISAVAACFESYGEDERTYLLNRLKPMANTPAILMGALAGQFLDEQLCGDDSESSYSESIRRFFHTNGFQLLTAGIENDFHEEARRQQEHVRQVVHQVLPRQLKDYRREDVMVEPSFFSEMLGLQGRMDFLQLDMRVLIEQKAGKGGFPQQDPQTPVYQEKHYVQMLLYMLLIRYNYRNQYERNHRELHEFLFYSKYDNGLLSLGFAPELVFRAMRIRNLIAAAEFSYVDADGKALDFLTTLTADDLNILHVGGRLWEQYQRPQIEALLQPIRQASPLEQAYFLRFLRFVSTEHLLAKVGNQTKEHSGFADKWYSSLEDKLLSGNIFAGLTMESPGPNDLETQRVERVVLRLDAHDGLGDVCNFREGDIVILYPYHQDEDPDARRTMVFRCTIEKLSADSLTLNLRTMQPAAHVFLRHGDCLWAVEHDFFDSSFTSLYRGLHAFLSAPRQRRDLLLLQRSPQVDFHLTPKGNYGTFNDMMTHVCQARDFFLIIGPPGTGKTSFGLMNTLREELLDPTASVLLMAYTNRAVDEICTKLEEQCLDFLRIGSRLSCPEEHRPYLLEEKSRSCGRLDDLRHIVCSARIVVGTTTALNARPSLFQLRHFSLAIIDEASQLLEPHLLGLLSACGPDPAKQGGEEVPAIRRFVMIGDHKQLPAVVGQSAEESAVTQQSLQDILLTNCRLSLFERLLRRYRNDPQVTYMLTRQGRMHHQIANFPSEAFYQGRLTEVPLPHQLIDRLTRTLDGQRVAFVNVEPELMPDNDKVNTAEAQVVAQLAHVCFQRTTNIGIIVPYRNQIAAIRSALADYGVEGLTDVAIDTVERFQGSQRDVIIYSFTVQRPYQLRFLTDSVFEEDGLLIDRKLNVAMTRAREQLFLVGYAPLLERAPVFRKLLCYLRQRHACYAPNREEPSAWLNN